MAERWDYRDDRGYRERNDRPVTDRAGDEVRSWFGDDEAARRRRADEARHERSHWTDRDRDGRTGLAEFADNDRPSYYSGYSRPSSRDDYRPRERGFGDTSRYPTEDRYTARNSAPYSNPQSGWQDTNYAGRGPRGYQRTDDRIREDVCDRLTDDPRIDASDIEVHMKDGELTLSGSVRTREEKRFTEDLVERITGVREVNNHLRVRPATEVLGTARSGASVLGLSDTPPPQTRNH
jgi:osmotically-inducible protein OsmY